jgi:hypothetical protein
MEPVGLAAVDVGKVGLQVAEVSSQQRGGDKGLFHGSISFL